MRVIRVIAMLGVVGSLAFGAAGDADARSEPQPPVMLGDVQLFDAMLELSDMPEDWVEVSSIRVQFEDLPPTDDTCGALSEAGRARDLGAKDARGISFAADWQVGPYFREALYVFPTRTAARSFLAEARELLTRCPTFPGTGTKGESITLSPTEIAFPEMAHEVVALRIASTESAPDEGVGYFSDQIYVRKANFVIAVGQTVSDVRRGRQFDPTFNVEHARIALRRLGVSIREARRARSGS